MKEKIDWRGVTFSILTCLMLVFSEAVFGQTYTIANLGSNSWSYSQAHGINGSGHVVGEYYPATFFYVLAFLWENGVVSDLGHLPGTPYAVAHGVNDTDQVVGESNTGFATHAFLYRNGTMTDLGTLGSVVGYSRALAINRSGEIVGEASLTNASIIHAVLYSGGTKMDLGALGGDYSSARAINNAGVIVGETDVVNLDVTNVHAFVYTNGVMRDLGTLGGAYSSASGINNSGVIVGEAETLIGGYTYLHAFVCRNGTMSDLGTLGGSVSSASAINNAGQVVGYATDSNEVAHAFLFAGSKMVDLNDFLPPDSGWTNLTSADALNDAGQIAGSGYRADGSYHAYLLTPKNGSPAPVSIFNPVFDGSRFSFSFQTQVGYTYQGEFANPLAATNSWLVFTNLIGDGSVVRVTDSNPPSAQRLYRVTAY